MSSLVELIRGEGRADAVVRAVLLSLMLAVSAALVWTTLSSRSAPAPYPYPQLTAEAPAPGGS